MQRFFCSSKSFYRMISAMIVSLTTLAFTQKAIATLPSVGITGNPFPPVNIGLGVANDITVSVTAYDGANAYRVGHFSSPSRSGPWTWKGDYYLSGGAPYGQHTFHVANYAYGSWYWAGYGEDTWGRSNTTPLAYGFGPYVTYP
ncbi:MAG TPA: hypothetical protein VNJ09_03275 [Chthonomonadales bacterium]|nr:hypothetical protein [Chthonomonadales bacterium]